MPDFFAVAAPGLETLTAGELSALGIAPVAVEPGGVSFSGALEAGWRANLELRTASRITMRLGQFTARTWFELERHANRLPWTDVLGPDTGADFEVSSRKSRLYHLRGIAERMEGWVSAPAGAVRRQRFIVRAVRDRFTISADMSGALLHRRGYRLETARAPMRETLAAAMLLASGWPGDVPLADPFCGSGTLPIEAALLARRMAPGLAREFAFEHWPSFERRGWEAVRATAHARVRTACPVRILGSDRDAGAIAAALANARRAGVDNDVQFERRPLSAMEGPGPLGCLLANPPYGERVSGRDLRDLYAQVGHVARRLLPGGNVGLLVSDPILAGQAGLRFSERFQTTNGGIEVRFLLAGVPALERISG